MEQIKVLGAIMCQGPDTSGQIAEAGCYVLNAQVTL